MKKNKTEELYANRHPIVKRNMSLIVQSPSVHSRLTKIIPRAAHRTVYGIQPYRHGALRFRNSWTRNRTVESLRLDGYGAAVLTVMTVKTVYRQ